MSYEIILIEEFNVNRDGNMEIVAILENMGPQTVRQSFWDAPEYAPARCKTTVPVEALPEGMTFKGKNTEDLEELTNRYCLLVNQEWEVIPPDCYDDDDNYYPSGVGLYF
jgi:hypothetical protein